jgi:hypothetical protein
MSLSRALPGLVLCGLILTVPVRAADADSKYLPNNSDAVISINVKQILASAALKAGVEQAKQVVQNQQQAKDVLDSLGFDPFKDLERVVIAGSGNGPDQAMVLLQGKFNVKKFTEMAEKAAGQQPNLKIIKEGGYTLYEVQTNQGQVQQVYVAIVDETAIALGPNKSLVVDTLDKKAGKKQSTQKKELLQLMAKADANQSVSIVVLSSGFQAVPAPELEKITNITGGLTLTDELKAELVVAAKNANDAKELSDKMRDGLNQAKALIAIAAGNDKRMAPIADFIGGVTVNAKDSGIIIRGRLTKEVIEELMKLRNLQ